MEETFRRLEALLEDVRKRLESIESRLQPEPACMSYPQAAVRLGVGLTKLKQMIARGEVRTTKVGRVPMVTMSEIRRVTTPEPERPKMERAERAKNWTPINRKRPRY